MLTSVVYTSASTKPFSSDDLVDLLAQARRKNAVAGLTGMLLYRDGIFMQALEGEDVALMNLLEKIRQDSRHRAYFECSHEQIARRQFPDWTMGFRNLDDTNAFADVDGYSDFMQRPLTAEAIAQDPSIVSKLLFMFHK